MIRHQKILPNGVCVALCENENGSFYARISGNGETRCSADCKRERAIDICRGWIARWENNDLQDERNFYEI